jgi:hypothetical protein
MRTLLIIAMTLPLLAQQPPAAAPAPAKDNAAPAPAPIDNNWLTGSIDLGYRWQTGVGGSSDAYRSLVNLGSGPKLLGADFTIIDPKTRLFDQIQVRAYSWGDEPYATFHLGARKKKLYEFNADYRDFAYFNYLPSYADPLLSSRGQILNQQSFDTRRRLGSFSLDLLPGNWITPYFAYDRDSGSGSGVTTFVSDADTFPVPNTLSDRTNLYRGGARIELKRLHVTLEEGGTTFQNNQTVYQTATSNFGNVTAPYFGQTLDLASLLATYGIHGDSTYSKGLLTANVTPWLDVYGQFLFSQPKTNVSYTQSDTGNLVLQSQVLFYSSQQYLVSAAAQMPHTTGSIGAEIRPLRRVRIVESWLTDRLHDSGSANSQQALSGLGASAQMAALLTSSLVTNYNQQEVDVFYDPLPKLVFHGGYRYVWGDANDAFLPAAGLASADQGKLRRNVGIGGVSFRPTQRISVSGDVEAASSGGAYFRTSLYNYQKFRAKARYQATSTISVSADFNFLHNDTPLAGAPYSYQAQQESLSVLWTPSGGKRWNLEGSYSRSTMYSDIGYLEPEFLSPQQSIYRDNAHTATALFNANLPRLSGRVPKITGGGSLFISSGSRPTSYYRPFAKVLLPVRKNLTWFTEWTYYGYEEKFYLYEGFRSHLVKTGLRFTR